MKSSIQNIFAAGLAFSLMTIGCSKVDNDLEKTAEVYSPPQEQLIQSNAIEGRRNESNPIRGDVSSKINTLNFEPQVAKVNSNVFGRQNVGEAEEEKRVSEIPRGIPNNLMAGQCSGEDLICDLDGANGIIQTGSVVPDPCFGVGPDHIVQVVNSAIAFFDKDSLGTPIFQNSLTNFFAPVFEGNQPFDPKCFYDHYDDRFVVIALQKNPPSGLGVSDSSVYIAVSDDGDPNGNWDVHRLFFSELTFLDIDYPGLGFDRNGVYVSFSLVATLQFSGARIISFDKQQLYGAGNSNHSKFNYAEPSGLNSFRAVQVAQHFGNNNQTYFVSFHNSTELRVLTLDDPFDENSTLNVSTVRIPHVTLPPDAPAGPNEDDINVLDGRLLNAIWRNGRLFTCHTIGSPNSDATVARWYDIETNPNVLVQSGELCVPDNPGASTYFPAVYTDAKNNLGIVFGASSPSDFPSVYFTGRLTIDDRGTTRNPVLAKLGLDARQCSFTNKPPCRWGDYFDIAIDPLDDTKLWFVGEYVDEDGEWKTWIGSTCLFVLGDVNEDGVLNLLDIRPFEELLANQEYHPAADINCDNKVNLLDVAPFEDLFQGL